jgi:formylglycine-generating enzyme required for sulfatase activity
MQPVSRLRLHLFGSLTVFPDDTPDKPLSIASRKGCAMLAYLAMQREARSRREELAKLLWGDRFDKQARQSLRQSVLALRRQLERAVPDLLVLDGEFVGLNAQAFSTDVHEFTALAEEGGDPKRALALYRGEFLAGFSLEAEPFDNWVRAERARFEAIHARLLQARATPTATLVEAFNSVPAAAPQPDRPRPIAHVAGDGEGAAAAPTPSSPDRVAEPLSETDGRFEPSAATSGWPWRIRNAWLLALVCIVVLAITALRFWLLAPDERVTAAPDHQAASLAASRGVSGARGPRRTFKDCDSCPEMVELPVGEFMMGSPPDERGREAVEGPQRRVVIAKPFALGRFEVTVDQLKAFVVETQASVGKTCHTRDPKGPLGPPNVSFDQPGFVLAGSHPAVCLSWHEAQAYVTWLARKTGKPYRLPSEAEWEFAARAGTTTSYSFGSDASKLCDYARFADLASIFAWGGACHSTATTHGPLPVGTLKPNPWGLFDMHGNVWEWVADCWTADVREMPADGSAFARAGYCKEGVARGGGWVTGYAGLRSAKRLPSSATGHYYAIGLRAALSLTRP